MSLIISDRLVLNDHGAEAPAGAPIIGWDNRVSRVGVTATSQETLHPAANLGNPSTAEYWRSTGNGAQTISIPLNGLTEVTYIGIAGHNFGSTRRTVRIDVTVSGGSWVTVVPQFLRSGDGVMLIRIPAVRADTMRILLGSGTGRARAAVISVGPGLFLQRNIYVGHSPITLSRSSRVSTGVSESGQFLGRILLGSDHSSGVSMKNITPGWYRERFDPFVEASQELPFFFAWRPGDYPLEVGYCWMDNTPVPTNAQNNGMMEVDFNFHGIVSANSSITVLDSL